jgi:hypothetical protein
MTIAKRISKRRSSDAGAVVGLLPDSHSARRYLLNHYLPEASAEAASAVAARLSKNRRRTHVVHRNQWECECRRIHPRLGPGYNGAMSECPSCRQKEPTS